MEIEDSNVSKKKKLYPLGDGTGMMKIERGIRTVFFRFLAPEGG